MNEAMKMKTTKDWLREFEAVGIVCGPMNNIDKVAADPQVTARQMIIEVHHPEAGNFKVVNSPIKLSRTPCNVERASPDLGEHTEEILKEFLGVQPEHYDKLKDLGIF
jgi:CoA:oxalate CoA-transferase